jgi:putative nucleotidyltransferase with HDIG domain
MAHIDVLREKIAELYEQKLDDRDEWTDWLYPNHVLVVAENAKQIAARVGADVALSEAAALLHDIADTHMARSNPEHETESLRMARQILQDCEYPAEQITMLVDDALRFHSCHGNERPKNQEGLVLATADSLAHLQTDFYVYATWKMGARSLEDVKSWVVQKIERDLNNKISFPEIREEARPDYEHIKALFSR